MTQSFRCNLCGLHSLCHSEWMQLSFFSNITHCYKSVVTVIVLLSPPPIWCSWILVALIHKHVYGVVLWQKCFTLPIMYITKLLLLLLLLLQASLWLIIIHKQFKSEYLHDCTYTRYVLWDGRYQLQDFCSECQDSCYCQTTGRYISDDSGIETRRPKNLSLITQTSSLNVLPCQYVMAEVVRMTNNTCCFVHRLPLNLSDPWHVSTVLLYSQKLHLNENARYYHAFCYSV